MCARRHIGPGHDRYVCERMMQSTSGNTGEMIMVRKLTFALIATTALGTAALAPTSASAWHGGFGGWHGGFHGWGYGGYGYRGYGGGYGYDWCSYRPYRCGW
jgi:hypothetical protein